MQFIHGKEDGSHMLAQFLACTCACANRQEVYVQENVIHLGHFDLGYDLRPFRNLKIVHRLVSIGLITKLQLLIANAGSNLND
ncbi:hypothetical protein D3C85_1591060 [compost metagenome]